MNGLPDGDSVGDLLREFYDAFGMPSEGPPPNVNVTALFDQSMPMADQAVLREAVANANARTQLNECRALVDDLATRLTGEELLRELSAVQLPAGRGLEELSSGVFWFALAASLDRRDGGLPVSPFDAAFDLPLPLKVQMVVHGSLVLRLYVALVYMREGVLADLIAAGARARGPCSERVRRLLNSDFVRLVRNALSHGSFSPCAAGLVFRDGDRSVFATPGFLNWLSQWLMLIQLQALASTGRNDG